MDELKDQTITVKGVTRRPHPIEFDRFLPWACKEFCIERYIVVNRAVQNAYIAAGMANKKQAMKRKQSKQLLSAVLIDDVESEYSKHSSFIEEVIDKDRIINVDTFYDTNENLVQLKLLNNKDIPRKLIQTVALAVPYHLHLTSITINSGLCVESLYEIAKFLPDSQITELWLDGTFVSEANYYILLTNSKLKLLSLAKCSINDAIVKTIADQLADPCPASKVLTALNLSTNRITDIGAKYLADVLRANRQLSYLNLADNMITDQGGFCILDTLQTFPLRTEEIIARRAKYVTYLKERNDLIKAFITELQTANPNKTAKQKISKKNKTETVSLLQIGTEKRSFVSNETKLPNDEIQEKAKCLAEEKLGYLNDAFSPRYTKTQGDEVHCLGNNTLCCLNIAYNNLTYASVKKLYEVLSTQKSLNSTPRGLTKVVIEGNLMPVACEEYQEINKLLGLGLGVPKKLSEVAMKPKSLKVRSAK